MKPTFTVLIGSKGRDTLRYTLESVCRQTLLPGDQVYVGFDANVLPALELTVLEQQVRSYSGRASMLGYRHLGIADTEKVIPPPWSIPATVIPAGQPYSWLGVEQINYALRELPITGSHVFTVGDDDVFVDGAFDALRQVCAVDQSRPVLYRFLAPTRNPLWDRPRLRSCLISGCCIAAPRQYVGLHPTTIETTHDFVWIDDIVAAARRDGRPPIWLDYVGVIARPWRNGGDRFRTLEPNEPRVVAEVPDES